MRPGKLRIETDSAFVVRQLQGDVSSSCDALRPVLAEAKAAINRYSNYCGKTLSIAHIPCELNSRVRGLAAAAANSPLQGQLNPAPGGRPTVGSWVKLTLRGPVLDPVTSRPRDPATSCLVKVTGFGETDEVSVTAAGSCATRVLHWEVVHDNGDVGSFENRRIVGWSYVPEPNADVLEAARCEVYNERRGSLSCAKCGSKDKELMVCSACKEVYYCSVACQRSHRPSHKQACRAAKLNRKAANTSTPDPRYPLASTDATIAAKQWTQQKDMHTILVNALQGNFEVRPLSNHGFCDFQRGPKASSMRSMFHYAIRSPGLREDITVKWNFNDGDLHAGAGGQVAAPTGCSLFLYLQQAGVDSNSLHTEGSLLLSRAIS